MGDDSSFSEDPFDSKSLPSDVTPFNARHKIKKCSFKYWKEWIEVGTMIAGIIVTFLIYLQWREMQRDRILDERAWISLGGVGLMLPYSASHVGIHTIIANTGKSPATLDSVHLIAGTYIASTGNFTTNNEKDLQGMVCAPGGSYPLMANGPLEIGSSEFTLLTNREMAIFFAIKIKYTDIFNGIHHTEETFLISGPEQQFSDNPIQTYGSGRMD